MSANPSTLDKIAAFFENLDAKAVDGLRLAMKLEPDAVALLHDIAGTTPTPPPVTAEQVAASGGSLEAKVNQIANAVASLANVVGELAKSAQAATKPAGQ